LLKQVKYACQESNHKLGVSSFLRGLETTATYDKASDEFVIHSPTLTATKWWIGMAGETATHTGKHALLQPECAYFGLSGIVPVDDGR
jgi:acyl-CoA oxidase